MADPDAQHEPASRQRTDAPSAPITADVAASPDPGFVLRHAVGNQAAQRLLRPGRVPGNLVLAPHSVSGNQTLQRLLRPRPLNTEPPAEAPPAIRRQPSGGTTSTWTQKTSATRTARAAKKDAEADKLTREAIAEAAAQATYPVGVAKTAPTPDEIGLDPKITEHAYAQVRPKDIPANPGNYWRWIWFAPGLIEGSELRARMFITHELVHIGQFKKIWEAFESDKSANKPGWEDYLKPFQKRDRVVGPEELEAHVTSLDFLKRLAPAEQVTALRGLYSSYIGTAAYTPPPGEGTAITTAEVGPRILQCFTAAEASLQVRMSQELWWSLMDSGPEKATFIAVLRELKPVARKSYDDPAYRSIYDEALASEGIKRADWL